MKEPDRRHERYYRMSTRSLQVAALLAVAGVLAASCNNDPAVTSSVSEDTTEAPATSVAAPATTTSLLPTSAPSSPPVTTATTTRAPDVGSSTPTTSGATGVWADQPLVVTGGPAGALGWWDGGQWVAVDANTVLPIDSGEDYQIALLGTNGVVTGHSQIARCDVVPTQGVAVAEGERLALLTAEGELIQGVAISAPWDLIPHSVELIGDDGTYAALAAELLAERDLIVDDPVIKQVIRFDLEGDGVHEVLVVAEDTEITFEPKPGNYSLAFLRRVTDGRVATWILAESVTTETKQDGPSRFSVSGIADLNNDAKMEIIVSSNSWEGGGVTVFEYIDDVLGPDMVMGAGCGS